MTRFAFRQLLALALFVAGGCWPLATARSADEAIGVDVQEAPLLAALERAGANRGEFTRALDQAPADQRAGLRFLVANMPVRDLHTLKAEFLLENCELAYRAWRESPWKEQIPEEVFFDSVLPYANINERRDAWRKDFAQRFRPLIEGARSPSEAAARLNQKIFPELKVKYSTARRKADQSPFESIESGLASCSGLAVLLVDACRAVGVPARFVGTPLWADKSGNHSWVEVWDNGWHFTGAAEPSGDQLDQAWFIGRASTARGDDPRHAIYAVTFRRTPLKFPLVWDPTIDYVCAVNVTERYVGRAEPVPEGHRRVMFRVVDARTGQRVAAQVTVNDASGKSLFTGESKDERFDTNDHLTATLRDATTCEVEAQRGAARVTATVVVSAERPLVTLQLENAGETKGTQGAAGTNETKEAGGTAKKDETSAAIVALGEYLARAPDQRPPLGEQAFARQPLRRAEAEQARQLLWKDHAARIRRERAAEMEAKELRQGELRMPFAYKIFGEAPADGRSLFISMHGGGGAPKQVNDQQWENQKRLYQPQEGVYVAPRAPTDTWNLWHQDHIDPLFDRLIENLIVFENVSPNRVYLLGYSAGGDGVYQVAPRMADRFAAAAMMAGHPNESTPRGLRNLPFAIHVGGKDSAYNRNEVARQWGEQLDKLHQEDADGYEHLVKIYPEKGHWMDREDAAALPWMAKFRRQPFPKRVVWRQDDVTEQRFYWLAVPADQRKAGAEIVARCDGQRIELTAKDGPKILVRLSDDLLDLDQPVTIVVGGQTQFEGPAPRTIAALHDSLSQRADPSSAATAVVEVALP